MSWELISSIMIITLRADYLAATRLSRHRAPLAADLFLCKQLCAGTTGWPLGPLRAEERLLRTGVQMLPKVRPSRSGEGRPVLPGCSRVPV